LPRDQFVDLSEKLCAIPIEDRSLADVIQNALSEQYNEGDFRRIAEALDSADRHAGALRSSLEQR
jgi:hypothetical protein